MSPAGTHDLDLEAGSWTATQSLSGGCVLLATGPWAPRGPLRWRALCHAQVTAARPPPLGDGCSEAASGQGTGVPSSR